RVDGPGALVAEHERQWHGPLAVDGVQVRVADAACAVAHPDFAGPGIGELERLDLERRVGRMEHRGAHGGRHGHCSISRTLRPVHDETTLPSGLRVISERIESVRSVAVGVFVGVGARDERPREAGVTHLIEHLLFKGSERFDQVEIARVSDRLGSELNAFTTRESTVVHVRVLDEHLPLALDVMCDMAASPRFEAEALEPEREVVLEEIAMIEDDPSDLVHDLAARCVFGEHELGRPVIGTAATLRALTTRDIAAYYGRRYGAGNVVVAAAGHLEHEAFRALVAERLQLGVAERAERSTPVVVGGQQLFLARDTEQYHVCLSAPGLPRDDDRRFALALLDHVLGGAASSRLVQEVREQRGMAYSVYSYV